MVRRHALLLLCFIAAASAQGSGSGSGSASGSGSGSADCSSAGCMHDCRDTAMGPMCFCPAGQRVNPEDMASCETCPGGTWGVDCAESCDCGADGNGCNNVDGTCICNLCWDNPGASCSDAAGPDCWEEFLTIPNKVTTILEDMYGGVVIPAIPADTIESLMADLLETNTNVIDSASFDVVERDEVNQGPLLKLTCTLDFNVDRPEVTSALANIRSSIKLGTYRATLVIQENTDTAEVTINAGTSYP